MSSIWHKAGFHEAVDDKLKVSKDGKWVYWTMYGWNIAGEDAHDIGCEWCYLDDLLALETELDRTRKALGIAVDALKEINDRYESEEQRGKEEDDSPDWWDFAMDTGEILAKALEQITAE